jgi:hypothetical protein
MYKYDGLQRVRYFAGQLLTADDFVTEQAYWIERQRRHNRHLHGWGVIKGLEVSIDGLKVFVEPGMAIDCAGNEIFLGKRAVLVAPRAAREIYIVVEYCEIERNPLPIICGPECSDSAMVVNTRVQEECRVYFSNSNPNSNHDGTGPGTSGCGSPHPIAIARLQKLVKGFHLIKCGQRVAHPTASKIIEPIKSTIMEFEKFLHWLTAHLEEHKQAATLGENSTFNARIGVDGRSLLIEFGSRGKSGQLSYDRLKLVWDRYMSLGNRKNLTSEYTDPSWPETPDRILAPYAAALIRDFGNDYQNSCQ